MNYCERIGDLLAIQFNRKMTKRTASTNDNIFNISETIQTTELDEIRHEAVVLHDDPVIAAKSFLSHEDVHITAAEYSEKNGSTDRPTGTTAESDDFWKTLITKYAEILTNVRSSLTIVLIIFLGVVVCAVYSLTKHPIPDFSDPSKGFEARGTLISKRLISAHHLIYAASIPNSLFTTPPSVLADAYTIQVNNYASPVITSLATTTTSETMLESITSVLAQETESKDTKTSSSLSSSTTTNNLIMPNITMQSSELLMWESLKTYNSSPVEISVIHDRQRRMSRSETDCLTIDEDYMAVVFTSNTAETNLFTKNGLQSICNWQRRIQNNYYNNFTSCTLLSVADFVLHLSNKTTCEDIADNDVDTARDLFSECSSYYLNFFLHHNCATRNCNVPKNCTKLNAVYDMLHYLTDSEFYNNEVNEQTDAGDFPYNLTATLVFIPFILEEENEAILYDILDSEFKRERVVENGASKIVAIKVDKYGVFFHYFWKDTFLVGGSASCIILVIWFYSKSLFITCMTLLNFVLSLVLAYFTYIVIARVEFFPFLAVTTGLLIVAIGADDTFVFLEIWNESNVCEKGIVNVMARTLRHAAPTMFVTSLTTSSAFFVNMISSITAVKCFGLYAGTAILFNFVLTLSWLPAIVIINEYIQRSPFMQRFTFNTKCFLDLNQKITNLSDALFKKWIPFLVIKLRLLWIILFSLMGLVGAFVVFVSPGLQLPTSNFPVFNDKNMIEIYESKYQKLFRFEKDSDGSSILNMQFIWGVKPVDNGDHWNPDDRGRLVFDKPLNLTPEVQQWMLNFCSMVRMQDFYEANSRHESCFIEAFISFMSRYCSTINNQTCCGMYNTSFDDDTFRLCLPKFLELYPKYKNYIFYDNKNILGARLQFPSNYTASRMYKPMDEYWSSVNSWSETEISTAPESLSGGWFITDHKMIQMYFYDLQKSLVKNGSIALLSSIGLAAVVLFIVTRNVLLSTFAMLSIMGTIFVTIGSLVLLGWELNVMESVIFSLAVGLSVDFTIHYGVAYRLAPFPDRQSRVCFSIRSLAPAITMAAFSTFVPGVCMFPAITLIYQQMAVFLTLIMSISLAYSTFFFQSICYMIGPQETACEFNIPCRETDSKEEDELSVTIKETKLIVVEFK
ncbi:protein dispatched homolog 1-like [Antedon mediterranea]|uniref:protein dispatched homolog 1-like n=1 Tax=Antedon mediterranea TaxID=105859 RepID=UPI003AF8806D